MGTVVSGRSLKNPTKADKNERFEGNINLQKKKGQKKGGLMQRNLNL